MLVLKNLRAEGLSGHGRGRQHAAAAELLRKGITDMVRISDARMSGTAYGTVVLHVAPEAAAGGHLALVQDGDIIELDVERRSCSCKSSDEELDSARASWKAPGAPMSRGYTKLYVDHVNQANKGADLDFLVGGSGSADAERQPLRHQAAGRKQCDALITDYDFHDLELEATLFRAGRCRVGQGAVPERRRGHRRGECDAGSAGAVRTGERRVFKARPEIGIASRYGAGFDTIETSPTPGDTASGSPTRRTTASARSRRMRSAWRWR